MGIEYKAIQFNRQKIIYDVILVLGVSLYIAIYIFSGIFFDPNASFITLRMRSFGSAAFILFHIVLMIGPLCRLYKRFLPLLYNRRHLGVMTFLTACFHAYYVTIEYHKWGKLEPIFNIFAGNTNYDLLTQFPFQTLGAVALLILLFMAATSHDFWLKNLKPPVWKSIHMLTYIAYVLVVMHVILGTMQFETDPVLIYSMLTGSSLVLILHMAAALKGFFSDRESSPDSGGYIRVGSPDEIQEGYAKVVHAENESIAIFKHQNKLYAVSNVCVHQNGPLGEGKIIDGCITCPWHGYQFYPENGRARAPFDEKIATYVLKLKERTIFVNSSPNLPGTRTEPIKV